MAGALKHRREERGCSVSSRAGGWGAEASMRGKGVQRSSNNESMALVPMK